MSRLVPTEIDEQGSPIRIFRTGRATAIFAASGGRVGEHDKAFAVGVIRRKVYERAEKQCEVCGELLTWQTMHMHERQFKGNGGEVSLANGQCLCAHCHLDGKHGDRRWGGRKRMPA